LQAEENLCGATLAGRVGVGLPPFSHRTRNGNDSEWVRNAAAGHRLLFADFLSFVVRRTADADDHTWKIADEALLHRSAILATGLPHPYSDPGERFYEWA
jgi:hypothetical protein